MKTRRIGVAVCILSLFLALGPLAPAESFPARFFGQGDGLENQSILALAQQRDGHIWIGTENGLFRYDGAYFREYGRADGITEPHIFALFVDREDTVWAGTPSGLFRFDGTRFQELRYQGKSLRVGTNSVLTETPQGELIALTSLGSFSAMKFAQNQQWVVETLHQRHPAFREGPGVDSVFSDTAGRIWLGFQHGICVLTRTGGWETLSGAPVDRYETLFQASDGRIWARGQNHIVNWEPESRDLRDVTASFPAQGLQTIYRHMVQDGFGQILTPTPQGFATWDGHRWSETRSTSKGSIDGATAVLADREGSVWIGTQGEGLIQSLGYRRWQNYSTAEGMESPSVFAIARDGKGRMWFGHLNGANLLLPGTGAIAPSPLAREKDATYVENLVSDQAGGIWAATLKGRIYHIDTQDRIDVRTSLDGDIQRIRLDGSGVLWIAASSGLYRLDCRAAGHACSPAPFTSPNWKSTFVDDMSFDAQGALWLVTDFGLDRIQNGAVKHFPIAGVANRFILIAVAADQTLWMAGHAPGVLRVDVSHGAAQVLEIHSRPELASDYIESLDADQNGRVWIGTDHGVNVMEAGRAARITDEDGLIWNDADWKAFLADKDGSVWIGTSGGVSHLLDPRTVLDRSPFAAAIGEARYNTAELQPDATVPWTGATTTLRFSGLTFRNNKTLIYHYRLEGFDSSTITTSMPFASFPKLPPGAYTLHVTAEDTVHGVLSLPAERHFVLTPPWWRTSWFYALLAVAGLGLIAFCWHLSNLALLAQKEKLERLVAERTRELERMATTDELTGLMNRSTIMAMLAAEADFARRNNTALCIALIDLDHFKQINDTLGHLAGDEVLSQAARRLQEAVRTTDAVGRYGGEEFLIIFRDVQQDFGMNRCEVLRRALCSVPVRIGGHSITVSGSIGLAWCRNATGPLAVLIAQADRAMYTAKKNGRNRVEYAFVGPQAQGTETYHIQ